MPPPAEPRRRLGARVKAALAALARPWEGRLDRRVGAIILATGASAAATLIVYAAGWWQDPATFAGAVFAGWVSGVAFFTVIGAVVAIVSLARPEEEGFEARARILFRGARGRHIDYMVGQIRRTLEPFAELVAMTIRVRDFDAATGRFYVETDNETTLCSYIVDASTACPTKLQLSAITQPPAGGAANRLLFLRVDADVLRGETVLGGSALTEEFSPEFAPGQRRVVAHRRLLWMQAETEDKSFEPARYTSRVTVRLENLLPSGVPVRASLSRDSGATFGPVELRSGASLLVIDEGGFEPAPYPPPPGAPPAPKVFVLRLLPP